MTSRIVVDEGKCTGHGRCYLAAPSLLVDDDEGFVALLPVASDVPAELLADADAAIGACPERALSLVTD